MSSFNYNRLRLWKPHAQNTQVFGWKELLEEWNDSLTMPPAIQTIIDNLKAASDPMSNHNPSIEDFLRYLNWEQEGIKWFLYETIALRWMWGESRLDYVRDLIQEVDSLNSNFPSFPGSTSTITIGHFLDTHLNIAERIYLGLLEPTSVSSHDHSVEEESSIYDTEDAETRSIPETPPENFLPTPRTPTRRIRSSRSPPNAPPRAVRPVRPTLSPLPVNLYAKYPPMDIILTRDDDSNNDDRITVKKYKDNDYSISFLDKHSKIPLRNNTGLTKNQVLQYFSIALRLLTKDESPYKGLQMNIPNMPSVVLSPTPSSSTRDLILESVSYTIDNWPTE
jgi:hypothetical protein